MQPSEALATHWDKPLSVSAIERNTKARQEAFFADDLIQTKAIRPFGMHTTGVMN